MATVALVDQGNWADDPVFHSRVRAATVRVAWDMSTAAPIVSGTGQASRLALVDAIVSEADFATEQFAWRIVSDPSLPASLADSNAITDTQIVNQITSHFDQVAQVLMPPPGGP